LLTCSPGGSEILYSINVNFRVDAAARPTTRAIRTRRPVREWVCCTPNRRICLARRTLPGRCKSAIPLRSRVAPSPSGTRPAVASRRRQPILLPYPIGLEHLEALHLPSRQRVGHQCCAVLLAPHPRRSQRYRSQDATVKDASVPAGIPQAHANLPTAAQPVVSTESGPSPSRSAQNSTPKLTQTTSKEQEPAKATTASSVKVVRTLLPPVRGHFMRVADVSRRQAGKGRQRQKTPWDSSGVSLSKHQPLRAGTYLLPLTLCQSRCTRYACSDQRLNCRSQQANPQMPACPV
jgi:hypothetical protein